MMEQASFSGSKAEVLGHAQTSSTKWRNINNDKPVQVIRKKVKQYSQPMPGDRT